MTANQIASKLRNAGIKAGKGQTANIILASLKNRQISKMEVRTILENVENVTLQHNPWGVTVIVK